MFGTFPAFPGWFSRPGEGHDAESLLAERVLGARVRRAAHQSVRLERVR